MEDVAEKYALKLLAQREHSVFELRQKLMRKGHDHGDITALLEKLIHQGFQSDLRFAEAYLYSRKSRGCGPLRVLQELSARGVSDEIVEAVVDVQAHEWIDVLKKTIDKKFVGGLSNCFAERAKQLQFLQYKGFNQWHINQYLNILK